MPKHHIIPKHEWLERFGTMNGVNSKDNLCNLTLHQHAEVHLLLYELNHNQYDLEAHEACVGTLLKRQEAKKERLHTIEHVKKHKKPRRSYRKWHI